MSFIAVFIGYIICKIPYFSSSMPFPCIKGPPIQCHYTCRAFCQLRMVINGRMNCLLY